MEGLHEDEGSMQCTEHPFKNNTPAGGICAICLQEKLGKLVSSSFPIAVFPSSSSSSPSFRSDNNITTTTITTTTTTTTTFSSASPPPQLPPLASNTQITRSNSTKCHHYHHHHHHSNRSRMLYLIGQKKKKKNNKNPVFQRSKSTGDGLCYTNMKNNVNNNEQKKMNINMTTPHKRGFWSFIHLQKHPHHHSTSSNNNNNNKSLTDISSNTLTASTRSQQSGHHEKENEIIIVEENENVPHTSFDRKVSRSRSVGCGSRSFSGDFFERISTGLGDCTLRRVESQRAAGQDGIKERVRCGGLFSGFMITSSSSSSSSSSYLVGSSSNPRENSNVTGKVTSAVAGRERGWGWALASPMRAFSKPSNKREGSKKNSSPNLAAIPSLLSVRS